MEDTKKFQYFIPIHPIRKSLLTLTKGGDVDFEVEGRIHEDRTDLQGEFIPTKIIDTQNLQKFGRLKYEHNDPNNPNPGNNIGFITEILRNEKSIDIKGRVFAKKGDTDNFKLAKQLMDDMNNVEEWNKSYQKNPKSYGLSLEGPMMVNKSTNQPVKVVASDVVFTTGPINQGSFANAVRKSLNATYEADPKKMKDADALKKESINLNKKRRKMKYANAKEAFDEFKKQGMTDTDAQEKADAIFESKSKIHKSLKAGIDTVTNSIKAIKDSEEELEDSQTKVKKIAKSIKAALNSEEGGKVDAEEFLEQQGNGIMGVYQEVINIRKSIGAQLTNVLNVQKNTLEVLDAMNTNNEVGFDSVDEVNIELVDLHKSLKRTVKGMTTDAASTEAAAADNNGEDSNKQPTAVQRAEKITKSLDKNRIANMLVNVATDPLQIKSILGEGLTPEIMTQEAGMARIVNYAYKSLTANCQRIIDVKFADEIAEILKPEAASA